MKNSDQEAPIEKVRSRPGKNHLSGFLTKVLAFAVLGASAAAQGITGGTIEGRVLNATNGNYLDKALVVVEGTSLQALTNGFGDYQIQNVPAGTVTLRVTYTGQPQQTVTAVVRPGETTNQDVRLGDAAGAKPDAPVVLNPFVVESERFKNAQQIAINEERRSVNIKNVVAADAFGDIPEGNIGEFIKFLPGVEITYGGTYTSEADASGISIRGFGPEDTAIYIDGVPVSSASPASLSRAVGLDQLSINNASRVELVKVPTPDMPSNSVGGSINLVSKSAFEYSKPTFGWRTYLSVNSDDPNIFKKVGGPTNKKQWGTLPGFDLTYARPISKTLGFSVTLASSNQFNENQRYRPEWSTTSVTGVDLRPFGLTNSATAVLSNAQGVASLVNPFMTRISITDSPRYSSRHSGSVKVDWRPQPGLTLAGSYQLSIYDSADAARRLQFRIQRPQSWDSTSSVSYPYVQPAQSANGVAFNPSSSLDMNIDSRDKIGMTHTGYISAKYQRGPWDIAAIASVSTSRGSYKDLEHGHFSTVDVSSTIGKMAFENVADGVAGKVTVLDRFNAPFEYTKLSNWGAPAIQARSGKAESLNDEFTYKLDVRRELDFLHMEKLKLAAKAGGYRQESLAKKWGVGTGYRLTYTGPAIASADYLDNVYIGNDPGYGFPAQQWISTYRLYDIYKANPGQFNANSDADQINNYNSYVNQNKRIKDISNSWYALLEGRAFNNRLTFVTGIRQEQSERTGRGPQTDSKWNFIKSPNGELYRDAAHPNGVRIDQATSDLFATTAAGTTLRSALTNARITYPDHVVTTTVLEGRMLQLKPLQAIHSSTKGKPSYSVNTSYNITENLVAKLAWSRTFGKISLEDATRGLLSGNGAFVINENETAGASPAGNIAVANPNLQPWISNNWDLALYYYTRTGGKIGASYYEKTVSNFQDTLTITSTDPNFNSVLESIGLNAKDYQDWTLTTSVNGAGTAKTSGFEYDVSQDLRIVPFLGDWGRRINTFATYTSKRRSQTNTTLLTARPASDRTASAGVQFATGRISLLLKATWSDIKFDGSTTNVTYNGATYQLGGYTPALTKVDASFNWQFSKKYGFFASGRDILNNGSRKERYDLTGLYPAYAQWDDLRHFGVQVTFGIKGSF